MERMIKEYMGLQSLKKEAEARMNELKSAIIAEMGGYGSIEAGGHVVTYGHTARVTIDTKALKADFPDVYSEYGKRSGYDTFTVK